MAKTGFVSGAGAHGLAFESAGDAHFSVTAVLVEEERRREVEEGFRRIRERHFPGGDTRFGTGPLIQAQQQEFLEELKELNFSFHALLVDKRKLHQKSPLQYKGTFYKFLSGLIYNYRTRYIHTHEVLQHLNSFKYELFTEHRFRSLVVGPVRDEGVLIVSSSAGYKLPCLVRDVYAFFNYYNQQIQPMLHRLGQCQRALELATGGELNVLEQPEYANLKKLLDKI